MNYNRLGYVVGPYRAASRLQVDCNIMEARFVALQMWMAGFPVVCPHLNTGRFDMYAPEVQDELWLNGALLIASRCDYAVCVKGYTASAGSQAELSQFVGENKHIYTSADLAIQTETHIRKGNFHA